MRQSCRGRLFGLLLCVAGSCSGGGAHETDPFEFKQIYALTGPSAGTSVDDVARIRKNQARVAELYANAVTRLDGVYGDGVGPARRSSDYIACRASFHRVSAEARTFDMAAPEMAATARVLQNCRAAALQWQRPSEMATFGQDIDEMAQVSMIVLQHTAKATDPSGADMPDRPGAARAGPTRSVD